MATTQHTKFFVDQLLKQAAPDGRWWLNVWMEQSRRDTWHRHANLVLEVPGQAPQQWSIHPGTFASLVNRLSKDESFTPPHLAGYAYDDYALVEARMVEACQLWHSGSKTVQQLLDGLYRLDDTAGIPMQPALAWRAQAESLYNRLKWEPLLKLWRATGPPAFERHSAVLLDHVTASTAVLDEIRRFLQARPEPVVVASYKGPVTRGKTEWYRLRHRILYERQTEFITLQSHADVWTYDVIHQREEATLEAQMILSQAAERNQVPLPVPTPGRPTVRQQLLAIRAQVDALLLRLDEENDAADE